MAKVALLIGVSEYEPGLPCLDAAVRDIEALRRVLQDPEMGGFDEVKILANPEAHTMQLEIETLFGGRAKDDLVLLFFSGHGVLDAEGTLYFASRNTRKNVNGDLIQSTAVETRFIHKIMNNSPAKRQAIILDCCYSGAFDPTLQPKDDGSVDLLKQLGSEGRVVLTSSNSTERSFEQQGADLSIYTRYLVEGIETGAGDQNGDGFVSMLELHEYAASKVRETAPKMTPKIIVMKDKGFEIVLAKAKVTDPKLKYRKTASRYANAGTIRPTGRAILDRLRQQLGLTLEEATEIEAEVLRPYQERLVNLQQYRETLIAEAKHEYPLSEFAREDLITLQQMLGLRDEDVLPIQEEVEAQFAHQSEAYQQHLAQYEVEFKHQEMLRLVSKTTGCDYTELRNFLRDKQWREADRETNKLMMIVAKPKYHWLDGESISNFPIEDLKLIDSLWVEYSEGRYGFSIQKEVWEECGRPGVVNDGTETEWRKFMDRVGWGGSYDELQFSPEKSPMTLPCWYTIGWFLKSSYIGSEEVGYSLFTHPALEILVSKTTGAEVEFKHQERLRQESEQQKQEREKAEYENNLRSYEREFQKALDAEYPLSQSALDEMNRIQVQLHLNEEDIARIEQPLRDKAERQNQEKLRRARVKEEAELQQREREKSKHQPELNAHLKQSSSIQSNIVSEVELKSGANISYITLQDLLKQGNWKEADRETFRAMWKAAGKTFGFGNGEFEAHFIHNSAIQKIPDTDWHTINNLWLKYSNGTLGFSLQFNIWQNLIDSKKKELSDCKGFFQTFNNLRSRPIDKLFRDQLDWNDRAGNPVTWNALDFTSPSKTIGSLPARCYFSGEGESVWISHENAREIYSQLEFIMKKWSFLISRH